MIESTALLQPAHVFKQFIADEIHSLRTIDAGHINETVLIQLVDGRHFILQKINTHVFQNVHGMMQNIQLVINHIRQKITAAQLPLDMTLQVINTASGNPYVIDEQGCYWRLYNYLFGTRTYNVIHNAALALQDGIAYGRFLGYLHDFDPKQLVDTIPGFHDVELRYAQFEAAVNEDSHQRQQTVLSEIDFYRARFKDMCLIQDAGKNKIIPIRVVHNDTKINNVLFNQFDEGVCVIDLDTVMPGFIHYDYSDAVRTGCVTADEDEADLNKVALNLEFFDAFIQGFCGELKAHMTESELALLADSTPLLPYLIGMRFLTDYLKGDRYFRIHDSQQNLRRTRTQIKIINEIDRLMPQIKKIIDRHAQ